MNKNHSTGVKLSDGTIIFIELEENHNEYDSSRVEISSNDKKKIPLFNKVKRQIRSMSVDLYDTIKEVAPTNFQIEFNVGFELDTDNTLSALLVKSKSSGTIKVTLGWDSSKPMMLKEVNEVE